MTQARPAGGHAVPVGAVAPLRVAFVGKGGAGKSSIVGLFARLLARSSDAPVLVLDSDPMPGLAYSLGVEPRDAGIPEEAVEPGPEGGPRFRLRPEWRPDRLVARAAVQAPDGVRLLQLGKSAGAGPGQPALHAYQQLLDALVAPPVAAGDDRSQVRPDPFPALPSWHVVADLPGGTRQPFMGWGRFADTFLVVVEPTAKSVLAARRLAHLASGWSHGRRFAIRAVANKVRDDADVDWVAQRSRLEVAAAIPWDEALDAADRAGRAPLDQVPDSAAVVAVAALVERLGAGREELG